MSKFLYIVFNKPYNVLCQFTGKEDERTLSEFGLPKEVYCAGRLDKDSEGLLLLTNDGLFNQKVTNPKSEKEKTYLVQVENIPEEASLLKLAKGVMIQGKKTLPAIVRNLGELDIPPRVPPIRERKNIPTTWLEIRIKEGRNRQVRRMTAAIGHPTLRLIRVAIGKYQMNNLASGQWREISPRDIL